MLRFCLAQNHEEKMIARGKQSEKNISTGAYQSNK